MNLSVHFIFALIPSIVLFSIDKTYGIAFFIGAFLIDIDHLIWYLMRYKSLNIKKAYKLHKYRENIDLDVLHVFHVWEFWALIAILSLFNNLFFIMLIGMIYHQIFDFYDLATHMECIDHRAISFFFWLKRHPRRL